MLKTHGDWTKANVWEGEEEYRNGKLLFISIPSDLFLETFLVRHTSFLTVRIESVHFSGNISFPREYFKLSETKCTTTIFYLLRENEKEGTPF